MSWKFRVLLCCIETGMAWELSGCDGIDGCIAFVMECMSVCVDVNRMAWRATFLSAFCPGLAV